MILRAASIALALFLAAPLTAIAQDRGQQQSTGDDDILDPGVLDRGATPTPTPARTQTPTNTATPTPTPTRKSTQGNQAGPTNRDTTDDDILGIGAGNETALESTVAPQIKEPPPQTKAAIDREIEAIGERAETYAEERSRLDTLARTDPDRAETEVRAAISESDREFDRIFDAASREGAADEVDEVSRAIGGDGRPASGTTGRTTSGSVWDSPEMRANRDRYLGSSSSSYGDPYGMYSRNGYEPIGYPSAGTPDSRMSWWQKLLLKSLEGVAEGVKGLSERRANELKRREEKLRAEYPAYREYVAAETRSRIERSAFAKYGSSGGGGVYDRRLDDLILGPARSGGLTTSSGSTPTSTASSGGGDLRSRVTDVRTGPLRGPVVPLKRVPDPVTGEPRIEIDMKLGEDPIRPIR
jgi:hypothetical protein